MNKETIIYIYIREYKLKIFIARETGTARKTFDTYIDEYKSTPRFKSVVTDKLVERIKFYL